MTYRSVFHKLCIALVSAWLAEQYRVNPEVKYVYPRDLLFEGEFPVAPTKDQCVKVTLEIVDIPHTMYTVVEAEKVELPA